MLGESRSSTHPSTTLPHSTQLCTGDPSTTLYHSTQLCTGAPRSHQRTWDENDFFRLLSAGSTAMVGLRPSISSPYAGANVGQQNEQGAEVKVFVTGATGFVGSHVAQELSRHGADLRILIRSSSNLANLEGIPAETVVGDLLQVDALRSAVSGCDAVMHVAADYRLWVTDPEKMNATNVTGTRELLRLAREQGVPRVVYTSSVATMGFFSDGRLCDEATPVSLDNMIGHYKRSKYLAEQEAVAAARAGQQVIILNPTTPIGSGDIKPTPTGRIIVDFLKRKFPAYMDTGLNLVDVEEVARTHVNALEVGQPGERYILGGENLTLKQLLDKMSAITGLPSPTMRVPHSVAMLFALWDQTFTGKLLRREPRATLEAVRMGKKMMFVSSAKAERDLGFRVVPVYAALRSAIDWFRANGYAPPA